MFHHHGFPSPSNRTLDVRRLSTDSGLPVDLEALKLDLRVDDGDEDDTITRIAQTAAGLIERRSGFVLAPGEFEATFDSFDWEGWIVMRSPLRDLQSLAAMTGKNEWTDLDLGDFQSIELQRGFKLAPFHCFSSPCLYTPQHGIRLRFTAGFDTEGQSEGNAASSGDDRPLDPTVRGVFIALCAHYYENRELFMADKLTEIEATAGGLLASIRTFW